MCGLIAGMVMTFLVMARFLWATPYGYFVAGFCAASALINFIEAVKGMRDDHSIP